MVNENQGKEYNPVKFYNRKLLRTILRNQAAKVAYGDINKRMALAFKRVRGSA